MSTKKKTGRSKPYVGKGRVKASASKSPVKQEKDESPQTETIKQTNTSTNTRTITKPQSEPQSGQSEPQSRVKKQPSGAVAREQTPESNATKRRHGLIALGVIGGTIVVGIIATLLGGPLDESYTKPPAYPPEWLFPVVWTILYISIGIVAYIAYLSVGDKTKRNLDIMWYGIHLFFNFMWPLFYFTLNWLIFACIWLLFVVITAIIVTYRYYRANLASGIVFTIYTIWLIYALYLSLATTIINV